MTNRIDISATDSTSVLDFFADVDFEVTTGTVTLADAINAAVIHKLEKNGELSAGRYNVRMLCIVTQNEAK